MKKGVDKKVAVGENAICSTLAGTDGGIESFYRSCDQRKMDKPIQIDPSTAKELKALLIDLRTLKSVTMIYDESEPKITGADSSSYIQAVWGSANPTALAALQEPLQCELLTKVVSKCRNSTSLCDAASKVVADTVAGLNARGESANIALQSKRITKMNQGFTGPLNVYLLTVWNIKSGGRSSIVPTDQGLIPHYDMHGNQLVEIHAGVGSPRARFGKRKSPELQRRIAVPEKKWWQFWK